MRQYFGGGVWSLVNKLEQLLSEASIRSYSLPYILTVSFKEFLSAGFLGSRLLVFGVDIPRV